MITALFFISMAMTTSASADFEIRFPPSPPINITPVLDEIESFLDDLETGLFPCQTYERRCQEAIDARQNLFQQIQSAHSQVTTLQAQLNTLLSWLQSCRRVNGFSQVGDDDPCWELSNQVGRLMRRIGHLIYHVIPSFEAQIPNAANAVYNACIQDRPPQCTEINLP